MTYASSKAASDVSLAPFGLRIIRAMQPSAARGETAEYVAKQSPRVGDRRDRHVAIVMARPAEPPVRKRSCAGKGFGTRTAAPSTPAGIWAATAPPREGAASTLRTRGRCRRSSSPAAGISRIRASTARALACPENEVEARQPAWPPCRVGHVSDCGSEATPWQAADDPAVTRLLWVVCGCFILFWPVSEVMAAPVGRRLNGAPGSGSLGSGL